jgi:choice-of-anchor A domain-containing protein/LPXTG-motif cell wall-anchored protein
LGRAGGYSAFVFGELSLNEGRVFGPLAVGGNATLLNVQVDSHPSVTASGQPLLLAGGSISLTSSQVAGGLAYGGQLTVVEAVYTGVAVPAEHPPDLTLDKQQLQAVSVEMATYAATVVPRFEGGEVVLAASGDGLSVASLTAAELDASTGLRLQLTGNSTLLLNISGASVTLPSFIGGSPDPGRVLFHFLEAQRVQLGGASVPGTLLAPYADVTADGAAVFGSLIAESLRGSIDLNPVPFTGSLQEITIEQVANSIRSEGPKNDYPPPASIATPPAQTQGLPQGQPSDDGEVIEEPAIPLGPPSTSPAPSTPGEQGEATLPETGESLPIGLYVTGILLLAAGIILAVRSRKKGG